MQPFVTITIPSPPMGKQRVAEGGGHRFTAEKTRKYETQLKWLGKIAMINRKALEGPVSVIMQAGYAIPASWSQRKQAEAARGEILPVVKPDLDNIAKTLDGLNDVVWKDDAQIVSLLVRKYYSLTPEVKIQVFDGNLMLGTMVWSDGGLKTNSVILP